MAVEQSNQKTGSNLRVIRFWSTVCKEDFSHFCCCESVHEFPGKILQDQMIIGKRVESISRR